MGSSMIGPGGLNAQMSADQAQEKQMLQQLQSPQSAQDAARIAKGSKEFEAMLLTSWLRQAEQSFATVPGADSGDDQDAAGRDQMMGLGMQSLAQAMVEAGGIGIAKMIDQAMMKKAEKAEAPAEPAGGEAKEIRRKN